MDIELGQTSAGSLTVAPATAGAAADGSSHNTPQDDDERFIVGLVLTYYRRHPQRARTRLLDLLGEVLTPPATPSPPPPPPASSAKGSGTMAEFEEWRRLQAGVAPLKPKKR
jgi:hypothetical protein